MKRRKRLTFWSANEQDDSLVRSVISGRKTVTAEALSEYYKPYGEFGDGGYEIGDFVEVYDAKKKLRCVIEILNVHTMKFGSIPESVWRGEGFSSAEEFRSCHIRCMEEHNLHDDFEFMIVHFKLIEEVKGEPNVEAGEQTAMA